MFEFFGLGKKKAAKPARDNGPPTAPQTVHLSATQLEVVRMTLHGVLKLNGIPGDWLSGEVIPVHLPGQGELCCCNWKLPTGTMPLCCMHQPSSKP
jgi:hypothetical protein